MSRARRFVGNRAAVAGTIVVILLVAVAVLAPWFSKDPTLIGLDLGVLLGGAVVTEFISAWPGLGREVLLAILEEDLPLILGVVLVSGLAIAIANLLADLAYLWLDPRLREP